MAGRTLTIGRLVLILAAVWAVWSNAAEPPQPYERFFSIDFVDGDRIWTNEDRAAVIRGFNYWAERLKGNEPDRLVKIQVKWEVGESNNAYSQNAFIDIPQPPEDEPQLRRTMAQGVIADGVHAEPPTDHNGVPLGFDGLIVFSPDSATTYSNSLNGPLPQSNWNMEAITIHELGHTLGYVSLRTTDQAGESYFSEPLTVFDSFRKSPIGSPATAGAPFFVDGDFHGPKAIKVFGGPVPIHSDGSHLYLDPFLMTHVHFRNYPFFTEVELAVLQDLGYAIERNRFFGKSYYTDGGGHVTNADPWTSDATYAVGVHVYADNRYVTQIGRITTTGRAATGIRIDGNDNVVTVARGTTIDVQGGRSAGILVSNGVGNIIVHQGDIQTAWTDSPGILADFGPNVLQAVTKRTSTTQGSYLVTAMDISGSIAAAGGSGNAIQIGETAGVREINFMRGADVKGNIWCDALTDEEYAINAPIITFGFAADGMGRVTQNVDPGFELVLDGNIGGGTLMTGILAGGTTVFNGVAVFDSLEVRPQAVLAGNGRVAAHFVMNYGDISPGDDSIGALRIESNLRNDPSSRMLVDISNPAPNGPGYSDLLVVRHTAELDGGTIHVNAALGDEYALGQSYTFLSSGDGLVVNDTPVFTDNLPTLRPIPRYNSTDFWFLIGRDVPFAEMGQTANQIGWGGYFDSAKYSPVAEIQQLRDTLDLTLDENDVRAAVDQMTGEIHGTLSILGIQSTTEFVRALATKMRAGPCLPMSVTYQDVAGAGMNRIRDGWVVGYGLSGRGDADGNAHAVRYSHGGTILGLSGLTQSGAECGMFYGYEVTQAKLEGIYSTNAGNTHRFGGYLNGCGEDSYHLLSVLFGFTSYEVQRSVVFDGYQATPTADHGGWQTALYCEKGLLLEGRFLTLQPYGGLQYVYLGQDAFAETGGDVFNLTVDRIDLHSLRSVLGSRLGSQPFFGELRCVFDTVWWHEFLDPTTAQYTAAFAAADQWRFTASGLDLGQDWYTVGPGLEWRLGHCSLFGKYEVMFNQHQAFHTGAGGLEWSW